MKHGVILTASLLIFCICTGFAQEKLLCDFEKENVAKWAKFYINKRKPLPEGSYQVRGRFVASKNGPATSGQWAACATFGAMGEDTRYWPGVREGRHIKGRQAYSLNTSADWSGYSLFEFNVWKKEPGTMRLVLVFEDRVISPPVTRRIELKNAEAWHTVRVPLDSLGTILNLKKMVNFWIIVEQSPGGELRIDDVRLAKGSPDKTLPILEDKSPVKETYEKLVKELSVIVPPEAKHNVRKVAGELQPQLPEPGSDPRRFTKPEKTEKFGLLKNLRQNTRRVYPYGLEFYNDKSVIIRYPTMGLAYTADAGKTWNKVSTLFGGVNRWRSEVSGDRGDLLYVGLGQCCGGGSPSSFYFRRIVHAGDGWKIGPAYPVDRDVRHCQDHYDILRLDSGRIWSAWNHKQRIGGYAAWARYSDDDGKTWKAAGATPRIGEKSGSMYLSADPKLVPFGKEVACMWPQFGKVQFSSNTEGSWTKPKPLPSDYIWSAACADGKTVYAVVGGRKRGKPVYLLRGDGEKWTQEATLPVVGILTVQKKSGRVHCIYSTKKDEKLQVFMMSCTSGEKWSAPKLIDVLPDSLSEADRIVVSLARWSPEEFIPVAAIGVKKNSVLWVQVSKVLLEK